MQRCGPSAAEQCIPLRHKRPCYLACASLWGAAGCRGRLSVIHGLLGAPPGSLFAQMDNSQNDFFVGDVKYHLGRSATLEYPLVRTGLLDTVPCSLRVLPNA